MPRNPSTPRIAIWRRLKSHGVVQLGDGLVALPNDARTKEQLEWVAAMVLEVGGEATVWVAVTGATKDAELIASLNADRDAEYQVLIEEIEAAEPTLDGRSISRLRREWRRIERRDHFRSPRRDQARLAVQSLALDARNAETKIAGTGEPKQ